MLNTWKKMLTTIYSYEKVDRRSVTKSLTELRPSLHMFHLDFMPTMDYYSICEIYSIFDRFTIVKVYAESYNYDITDVTRQFLVDLFLAQYKNLLTAVQSKNR